MHQERCAHEVARQAAHHLDRVILGRDLDVPGIGPAWTGKLGPARPQSEHEHLGLDRSPNMVLEVARPPTVDTRPPLAEDVRNQLVELYAPDVVALAARFPDIDLTQWPNFAYLATGNEPPAVESPSASNSPTRRT